MFLRWIHRFLGNDRETKQSEGMCSLSPLAHPAGEAFTIVPFTKKWKDNKGNEGKIRCKNSGLKTNFQRKPVNFNRLVYMFELKLEAGMVVLAAELHFDGQQNRAR